MWGILILSPSPRGRSIKDEVIPVFHNELNRISQLPRPSGRWENLNHFSGFSHYVE